jgi:MFS family permease
MKTSALTLLRRNATLLIMDGSFFGFAMGFASFTTVIPLFLSTLTSSTILIGLIPAVRTMGYQLPPLFVASAVARRKYYHGMVLLNTLHERIPFLGLALIAYFHASLGNELSVALAFAMIIWHGLGGGLTANPFQNLIVRMFPPEYRATVLGMQSSGNNLLAGGGAILAGVLLSRLPEPLNYTACFLMAAVGVTISYVCLAGLREPQRNGDDLPVNQIPFYGGIRDILSRDRSFRWFLVARMLAQFAMMASAFYMIYAVRHLGMSAANAAVMTSVLFITQVIANPGIGWLSDRWSRKGVLEIGALTLAFGPLLAWLSPNQGWFAVVFVLAGASNAIFFILGLVFTMQFGSDEERPLYFGMANTLTAPVTIVAPLLGGWMADTWGFASTFLSATLAGVLSLIVLHFWVKEPGKK